MIKSTAFLLVYCLISSFCYAKDPTMPPSFINGTTAVNKNKPVKNHWNLQQIIEAGGDSTVVINNKLLSFGESINGYKVVTIRNDSVVLKKSTATKTLYIYKSVTQ